MLNQFESLNCEAAEKAKKVGSIRTATEYIRALCLTEVRSPGCPRKFVIPIPSNGQEFKPKEDKDNMYFVQTFACFVRLQLSNHRQFIARVCVGRSIRFNELWNRK